MTETLSTLKLGSSGGGSQPVLLLRNTKSGDGETRRYPLQKFRLSIGRAPDDDICLSEGSGVSRNHASVLVLDGEVVIEDLGSRNGTYVNRKLIRGSRQTTLKFGDVITIGRYRLKLVDEAATEDADTTTSDVQELLGSWSVAAAMSDAPHCPLCHEARCADLDEQPIDADTDADSKELAGQVIESSADVPCDTAIIPLPYPVHGREYGRKLSRRPSLRKRPAPSKRVGLVSGKRSSGLCMSAASQRAHSTGLQ